MTTVFKRRMMAATLLATTSFAAFADGVSIGGDLVITIPTPTDTPVFHPIGTTINGVTPLSGTMVFEYAQPALDVWDAGIRSAFRPVSPAELLTTYEPTYSNYERVALTTKTDSVSIGFLSHEINRITTTGGIQQVAAPTRSVNGGGTLQLTNWGYNASNQTIFADVLALGASNSMSFYQVPIWLARQSSQDVKVERLSDETDLVSYSIILSSLALTDAGRQAFATGLGIGPVSFSLLPMTDGQWGSATFTTQLSAPTGYFAATVPEPETYVLMALGLIGVTAAVRRRQAH